MLIEKISYLGNINFPNIINALKELSELFSKSVRELSALLFMSLSVYWYLIYFSS